MLSSYNQMTHLNSLRWLKESELLPVRKHIHYSDWRKVNCCLWGNIFITITEGKWAAACEGTFIMMTEGNWVAACEEIYSLWWLKESKLLPVRKYNWDIVHALWVLFTLINDLFIALRKQQWIGCWGTCLITAAKTEIKGMCFCNKLPKIWAWIAQC